MDQSHPSDISLDKVMTFRHPGLLLRVQKKYSWSPDQAEDVFQDMKRFLYLCAKNPSVTYAPPEKIDDCWHEFILFTLDYFKFCKDHLGRFIHHKPQTPGGGGDKKVIPRTVEAARAEFGQNLSSIWYYPGFKVDAVGEDHECDKCAGSTNCQSVSFVLGEDGKGKH